MADPLTRIEWAPPLPRDEAFVRAVLVNVAQADQRARELATGRRGYVKLKGRCSGCGCPLDEHTDGCDRCWNRHYMRSRAAGATLAAT